MHPHQVPAQPAPPELDLHPLRGVRLGAPERVLHDLPVFRRHAFKDMQPFDAQHFRVASGDPVIAVVDADNGQVAVMVFIEGHAADDIIQEFL